MSNSVVVLQNGYCKPQKDGKGFSADCSITLIKSKEAGNILVDTGGPWNKDKLISLLEEQNLNVKDITTLVCTHGHSDHVGNLNLFSCKTIVSRDISVGDLYENFSFESQKSYKLSDDIDIIPTPGHTHSDVSVVVRNTDHGTIVVAGDLFESEEDQYDGSLWKDNSENPQLQAEHRQKVLEIANHIVPGHGPMFAVKKS
ncbi:metallo-beta-lactamase domain-containing protein 1-like [Styela clava]